MCGAIDKGKGRFCFGKPLPDELEHQELVEVCVEKRAGDGVQLPVVIVGAAREVDDHNEITLLQMEYGEGK